MELKPGTAAKLRGFVQRAMGGKNQYLVTEHDTYVPWWMVSIIAERESTQDFSRSLAQGDRWNKRSTNEPISGPFRSWEDAAVWALHHDGLDAVKDWRLEKVFYYLERYNGWGYYLYHGHMPSPYIWGGTSVQRRGKYVRDRVWDPTKWDEQLGAAAMLKSLMNADPSIQPIRET